VNTTHTTTAAGTSTGLPSRGLGCVAGALIIARGNRTAPPYSQCEFASMPAASATGDESDQYAAGTHHTEPTSASAVIPAAAPRGLRLD
jgi:hypothetical protein